MTVAFYNKTLVSDSEVSQQILTLTAALIDKIIQTVRDNNLLDLPEHIDVVLLSTLDEGVAAQADVDQALIEVDPAQPPNVLVESIIHELIHLEQGFIGWLKGSDEPFGMIWFDKFFDMPVTDEEYYAVPWERDAWRRTPEIVREYKRCLKDSAGTSGASYAKRTLH